MSIPKLSRPRLVIAPIIFLEKGAKGAFKENNTGSFAGGKWAVF